MGRRPRLTDKEMNALKAIDAVERKTGRIPMLKDLAWELEVVESTAARYVYRLKDYGIVSHDGPKTLAITEVGRRILDELQPMAV